MKEASFSFTFQVHVLGCKVNQYEAQQIQELLIRGGGREAGSEDPVDIAVVHSCAVTAGALRKSMQKTRQLIEQHGQSCHVILTGCVSAVPDVQAPRGVCCMIPPGENWLNDVSMQVAKFVPGFLFHGDDSMLVGEFRRHHRAFLKIQDGCSNVCTYCIVPTLRKASRDKPLDEIMKEANALIEAGHRELVVSGICVGEYGLSGGETALSGVLEALLERTRIERIRLSSLHPQDITDSLIDVLASSERIMPHVHLPLQAGSDNVLQKMNRGYTQKEFLQAADRIRNRMGRVAFSTDVIVAFPGETDDDFEQTCEVSRKVGFSRMHIFPFSPRPGVAAASFPGRLPAEVITRRKKQLQAVAVENQVLFYRSLLGKTLKVLVETQGVEEHSWEGYSEHYVRTRFVDEQGDPRGKIIHVRAESTSGDGILGIKER